MQVRDILGDKGRDVVTITSDATLSEAACLLAHKRIGALIVRDSDEALAGILSERDIVRALAEASGNALAHTVASYMTRDIESCAEGDSIEVLMETMTHRRLRHIPVLHDGRLCGIVSIGDVVKTRIAETVHEAETLRGYITAG